MNTQAGSFVVNTFQLNYTHALREMKLAGRRLTSNVNSDPEGIMPLKVEFHSPILRSRSIGYSAINSNDSISVSFSYIKMNYRDCYTSITLDKCAEYHVTHELSGEKPPLLETMSQDDCQLRHAISAASLKYGCRLVSRRVVACYGI